MAELAERRLVPAKPREPAPKHGAQRHEALERRAAGEAAAGYGAMLNARRAGPQPIQRAPDRSGLPDRLKAGVEALSGPVQRKSDAKYDPDAGQKEVEGLKKNVKKLDPNRLEDLKGKLTKSELARDLERISAEQDQVVAAAKLDKETKQAALPEFMKTKPDKDAKKAKIDESIAATKTFNEAMANRPKVLEARKAEIPHLANSASLSWVDRHKAVMTAAKTADPLMRSLRATGNLSATHERGADAREQDGKLKGTRALVEGQGATMESGNPLSIVGADEFLNKPEDDKRGAPILPELTKSDTKSRKGSDALTSTADAWGEADVNRLMGKERDAIRLLHTKPESALKPKLDKKGQPLKAEKLDSEFYLSVDHYESAIPMSPVEDGYKRKRAPQYDVKKGGPNSLKQHDAEETKRKLAEQQAIDEANKKKASASPSVVKPSQPAEATRKKVDPQPSTAKPTVNEDARQKLRKKLADLKAARTSYK